MKQNKDLIDPLSQTIEGKFKDLETQFTQLKITNSNQIEKHPQQANQKRQSFTINQSDR